MVKTLKYVTLIVFCAAVVACKKKATITAKVYNVNVHEFTPNATVLLVEKHYRKRLYDPYGLGPYVNCKIISEKETDANGVVVFDEKLKINENHVYVLYVKNAWGIESTYTCGEGIEYGKKSEVYLDDKRRAGGFQFQINNFFAGAIVGDSIIIHTIKLIHPDIYSNQIFETGFNYTIMKAYNNTPQPGIILTDLYEDNGIFLIEIRKQKSGIVTTTIDTIKSYPNQTKIIQVNW